MIQVMLKQKIEYIRYKVININGKQMVVIPKANYFENNIRRIDKKLNEINNTINTMINICKNVEICIIYLSFSIISYYLFELLIEEWLLK